MSNILKANGILLYDPPRSIVNETETVNERNEVVKVVKGVTEGRKRVDMPWLVLNTSDTISYYYRWWIEKEVYRNLARTSIYDGKSADPDLIVNMNRGVKLAKPMWGTHISIIDGREPIPHQNKWRKYQEEIIEYEYLPFPYLNWKFWCLPVRCRRLEEIRRELGLHPFTTRSKSFHEQHTNENFNFHITVGRLNEEGYLNDKNRNAAK